MSDPLKNVYAQVRLSTEGGTEIDISGFDSIKCRLQLGAADEFTINMPAQLLDGEWRSDMGQWQVGATLSFEIGYDGSLAELQKFEIVSTTVGYKDGGEETMVVRAVSDLARAARNSEKRVFDSGSDADIITEICTEYGWTNGVGGQLLDPRTRLKKKGTSDLTFLKRIAAGAQRGGPTLDNTDTLRMPEPTVGPLKFTRGSSETAGSDFLRMLSLSINRDGGPVKTLVGITSWDPDAEAFVKVVFEANAFGGDPVIKYEGVSASKETPDESTTTGLVLSVIEQRGHGSTERSDVIATGRFVNEDSAIDLAKRWFDLREKLSRWATAKLEGSFDLTPYESFKLDGNLAAMDKGDWLPIWIEHTVDRSGWLSTARAIRIIDEKVVTTPTE